jgi:serine/threonine-protein kinase
LLKPGLTSGTNSIAVLPFENLSGDPAQGYFAAGIAGEIRNTLTRIAGLKVAGSISSEAVRNDDAQAAAARLGVSNILTGNVRQTASTIRVTAELIDGRTGLAKWSETYDRAPGDVIKIQTDIAQNVARALAIALSASVKKALAAGETSNVAAQQLVYQARALSYQWTVPAFQRSLQLLDQAISLDPNYARAHAMKSFVANNLASAASTPAGLAKGRAEALQYAKTALSIAPDLPIAHSALAYAYSNNLQLKEALREHSVALSLGGGDPDVIRNYGWDRSTILGARATDALRYVDEALALDPLNSASHLAHVDVLFTWRRYAEAVSYSLKLQRESPDLFTFPDTFGRSLLMLGKVKEAASEFAQVEDANDRAVSEALLAARTGARDVALGKLAALRERMGDMASWVSGQIYAQAGDKDRAFAALRRALELRISWLAGLNSDPFIDPLRSDPRYAPLAAAIGFPV